MALRWLSGKFQGRHTNSSDQRKMGPNDPWKAAFQGIHDTTLWTTLGNSDKRSKDRFPLNRRMAIAISIPICFLVLLAVLAVVVYCSRTRRTHRRLNSRNDSEYYRNNVVDTSDEAFAQPYQDHEDSPALATTVQDERSGPLRTSKRPSSASHVQPSSTAVEHGEVLSSRGTGENIEGQRHRSQPPSSTHSQTIRSVDSSSDDNFIGSYFSGIEDPFSDSSAVEASNITKDEDSAAVSPSTGFPLAHHHQEDTLARAIASELNSAIDRRVERQDMQTSSSSDSRNSDHSQES